MAEVSTQRQFRTEAKSGYRSELTTQDIAKEFIEQNSTLRFRYGEAYIFDRSTYCKVDDDEFEAIVQKFLTDLFEKRHKAAIEHHRKNKKKGRPPAKRDLTASLKRSVMEFLKTERTVPQSKSVPCWVGEIADQPDPKNCIVLRDKIVDITEWRNGNFGWGNLYLWEPVPDLFQPMPINAYWNEKATCPVWLSTLGSQWKLKSDYISRFQEVVGYFLLGDNYLQKIIAMIGPPRSTKGTFTHVIKQLVPNHIGTSFSSLKGDFGLERFPNKSLAVLGDARLGHKSQDVVEQLLTISGGDTVPINRKNKEIIHAKLPLNLLLTSNETPDLADASNAIQSRLILFRTFNSFLDNEDTDLQSKLDEELDGIFIWALEGLERVLKSGKLAQPKFSKQTMLRMARSASPIKTFIDQFIEEGPDYFQPKKDVWQLYQAWAESSGIRERYADNQFSLKLTDALPELGSSQIRIPSGDRPTVWKGIRLKRSAYEFRNKVEFLVLPDPPDFKRRSP